MTRAIVVLPSHRDDMKGHRRYWVPITNIRVIQPTTTSVIAQFSNCTQKYDAEENYQKGYKAVYDPMAPNVRLEFTFRDKLSTERFYYALLHPYESVFQPANDLSFLPHSHLEIRSLEIDGDEQVLCILVWSYSMERGSGREICTMDLGCLSAHMDFDIRVFDDHFSLELRHLKKIKYYPVDVEGATYWPPPKVQEHNDGAPGSVGFDSAAEDDNLVVKAPLDRGLELLQGMIGYITQHQAEGYFCVEYAYRSSNPLRRWTGQEGQLTVWSNQQTHRFLLRATAEDTDSPRWSIWTAGLLSRYDSKRSVSHPQTTGDNTVLLEGVEVVECDCVSMELQPHFENDNDIMMPEQTTIRLKFRSPGEMNDFKQLLP